MNDWVDPVGNYDYDGMKKKVLNQGLSKQFLSIIIKTGVKVSFHVYFVYRHRQSFVTINSNNNINFYNFFSSH